MEGLALALWTALMCAELAGGRTVTVATTNLSCYQCFKSVNLSLCRPKSCSLGDKVCVSNVVIYYFKSRVRVLASKRCAIRCPNGNSEFWWSPTLDTRAKITRRCCSWNLCNVAPTPRRGAWALQGGLLLCTSLGLLWALL
ncbi:lymphocyte antigen 6L [Tamandua tetradactyla]|uniref:lymphocyte antigen 6L n=1 Tax=Tamandua tetradactyla TaxID=48850 RepID=UPI004053D730